MRLLDTIPLKLFGSPNCLDLVYLGSCKVNYNLYHDPCSKYFVKVDKIVFFFLSDHRKEKKKKSKAMKHTCNFDSIDLGLIIHSCWTCFQ